MRTERPHEPVRLLDQRAQLGFGHGLIREYLPQSFEEGKVRKLGHAQA
jgi:hypothetical protein